MSNQITIIADFIQLLPEPCAVIDTDGKLSAVNAAWRDVFFHDGVGEPLIDACTKLFRVDSIYWDSVQQDLQGLLDQSLSKVYFEACLTEPPERWFTNTLAAHPTYPDLLIWQMHDISEWRLAEQETNRIWFQVRDALSSISDGFAYYDANDILVFCNEAYRAQFQENRDLVVIGHSFEQILRRAVQHQHYPDAIGREEAWITERMRQHRNYEAVELLIRGEHWIRSIDQPTLNGGTVCIRSDVTYLKRTEELQQQSAEQARMLNAQAALLAEMSAPLLRISERAVLMPLIGLLDSARAALTIDTLLQAVSEQRVAVVVLDVTGLPVVDTQIANLLIRCAKALRLLGANTVLTGIRPDVAQTMIALGIDLGDITTRADLMGGIAYALRVRK